MKFAIIEIKMAMIKLLRSYEVHACDKTPKHLELIEGVVRVPKEPIVLSFQKRTFQ